jgi:hypothetical protein
MTTSKPDSLVSQTRPFGFRRLQLEGNLEDHCAWDGSSTSLLSPRTHAQLEKEGPTEESTKVAGGCGREGKR